MATHWCSATRAGQKPYKNRSFPHLRLQLCLEFRVKGEVLRANGARSREVYWSELVTQS